MIYDKYNLKTYLYPLWKGNTVYNETLWFAGDNEAPLLYDPDEILAVKSYDLKTNYEEDVDYILDGNKLLITDDSAIPYMTQNQFLMSSAGSITVQHLASNTGVFNAVLDGKYCYAAEGATISQKQVAVTYTHSDTKNWTLPLVETAKFPKTMAKLANGEAIKVVFYGDSITVGANSSEFVNIEPKTESYANMVKSYISARYPNAQVSFKNTAVGGTDSNWGAGRSSGNSAIDTIQPNEDSDHFKVRVLDENPDLLFIAFGMNDQAQSPYDIVNYGTTQSDGSYYDNIRSMIERARAQNPNVEIMLVSSMIANPETLFYNKDYAEYQNALLRLSSEFENVGVSTVYNTVTSLYANGKRFQDCTGNNVNHPNDFMTRVYAQTVLYSLFGEDYYKAI